MRSSHKTLRREMKFSYLGELRRSSDIFKFLLEMTQVLKVILLRFTPSVPPLISHLAQGFLYSEETL
jgi:hypothetical protein